MKPLLLIFVFVLSIFPIETHKILLIGFANYSCQNETNQSKFIFQILFKRNTTSFPGYPFLIFNAKVSNNTGNKDMQLNCSNSLNESDNLFYKCEDKVDLQNITKVIYSKISLFSNGTHNFTIDDDDILKTTLADKTRNDIQNQNQNISYHTFYLNEVLYEKNNITLNGIFNTSLINQMAYFSLGGEFYILSINDSEIKFSADEYIDEHMIGKMGQLTDGEEYILIYMNKSVNDLVRYIKPESNLFVELIGAGAFKKEPRQNAIGRIYIRGSSELLKSLRKYIRFTASARNRTSKLRNLQDSKTVNVTATGVKISNESSSIAIYNVTYTNSSNTNFTDLTPNNDFEFSQTEDFRFTEHQITKAVNTKLNLTETNTETPEEIILKKHPYHKTPSSFEFDFNVSNPLNLTENQTNAYMKYPIRIGSYDEEEIACTLINNVINNGYYKIKCSTKNTIYALMKDLKILVPKKSSRKRILAGETNINKTLLFPADANHIMEYEYSVEPNSFNPRANKNTGLTAGAIVAIVLATVAAVVAVGIVLFFLNRIKTTPPVLNNTNDFNMVNSTSNMNH